MAYSLTWLQLAGLNWLIGDRLVISHVRILEQSTRRLAITHLIGLLTPEL